MEGGDGMSADPPSFRRMEGANMSATPPLNLVTPVQTSQAMSSSNFWSLTDSVLIHEDGTGGLVHSGQGGLVHSGQGGLVHSGQGGLVHSGQGGLVHSGQGTLVHSGQGGTVLIQNDGLVGGVGGVLVSGDTGILVGQVGGLDSVTRFVSVSELSKLGINLTASDIARLTGVEERSSLTQEASSNNEHNSLMQETSSSNQQLNVNMEEITLDNIDLNIPRSSIDSMTNAVAPRMVYQEKFLEQTLAKSLSNISEPNRINISDVRLVVQNEAKLSNLDHINIDSMANSVPHPSSMLSSTNSILTSTNSSSTETKSIISQSTSESVQPDKKVIQLVGQSLPESMNLHPEKPKINVSPLKKVMDKTFPAVIKEEIFNEFKMGEGHDVLWKCDGGGFRAHKFVLAMSSQYLKEILLDGSEQSMIYTPDLSSQVVKSILCLFYTGRVNISWQILSDLNNAFKLIGFSGDNVTLTPAGGVKEEETPDYEPISDYLEVQLSGKKRKRKRNGYNTDDDFVVGDSAYDEDILGLGSDDEDWTPKKIKKRVKSEFSSDDDEKETKFNFPGAGLKRGRKSLKTPDTSERFRTRGPGKGERSYKLAQDLFDGRHTDFIYACHSCYQYFDTEKKLNTHKDEVHGFVAVKGEHHTLNSKEYHCDTCSETIAVKHLVWFIKHLKYCGKDNERAHQFIAADDYSSDEEDNPSFRKIYKKRTHDDKDTAERLRITGEQKGRNLQTLSKLLMGEVVDYIWGCLTCYSVHLSESDLEKHVTEEHQGERKPGECWNPGTENYTCQHCKQVQHSRHLVWFIYHMRKCLVGPTSQVVIKKEQNEEEETDEDTTEDVQDPLGVVNKIYRVCNEKSEWICQALFGRSLSLLYPCHICYSVFIGESGLRQHCRSNHPGQNNTPENGVYYNKTESAYQCPGCMKSVCKNQKNSIYFTYHYRKCNGHTFPVTKTCPDCSKVFDVYASYKLHIDTKCGTTQFICHACSKVFPSNARLNHHVQYVHSALKPFTCSQCDKSYKRKAELLEHEEMSHSMHFNYSCEKCGKQFYGKKNLALHMKTHYSEEEKKHVCSICGYRFAKVKFLKNHMTTHSDVRQFSCEVCGARVKTRDTLKQHRKKLHNLLTPVPKTALVLDPSTGLQQTVFIKDE